MRLAYAVATPDTHGDFMGFSGNFDKNINDIKCIGYPAVELSIRNPRDMNVAHVVEQIERSGLHVAAVGANHAVKEDGLTLMSENFDIRQRAKERAKDLVEFAARFGAPVSIGKFRGNISTIEKRIALNTLADALREICEFAVRKDVDMMIEAQNANNIDNLNTVDETLQWIDSLEMPNLYIHLDTLHIHDTEKSPSDSIVRAGQKIRYVHGSDSRRLVPGTGDIELKKMFSALKSIDYRGYVGMEIEQKPSSYAAAAASFNAMSQIFSSLSIGVASSEKEGD